MKSAMPWQQRGRRGLHGCCRGWWVFCGSIKILADQILLIEIVSDSTYDENVPIRPFNKFWTSLVAIYSIASKAPWRAGFKHSRGSLRIVQCWFGSKWPLYRCNKCYKIGNLADMIVGHFNFWLVSCNLYMKNVLHDVIAELFGMQVFAICDQSIMYL